MFRSSSIRSLKQCTKSKRKVSNTINWIELRDLVHKTAVEHGWHDEPRSFSELICLFHCELSEAVEELRKGDGHDYYHAENGKPEGFYVELTDCIIRILDYFGENGIEPEEEDDEIIALLPKDRLGAIAGIHASISLDFLNTALLELAHLLEREGQDVEKLIREKDEYNSHRQYKHGKKF